MRRSAVLDQVVLDTSLTLEQKGLYALLCVLCKDGKSIHIMDLAKEAGLAKATLRRHLSPLVERGLARLGKATDDLRAQSVTIANPFEDLAKAMISTITRHLGHARERIRLEGSRESVGETLMKEWLSLLIDGPSYMNNARPSFLVSPLSGELLEYDRWYPDLKLAWEFHGPQHFKTSEYQPDPQRLARQQNNDLVKIGLSQRAGITLVEVQAEDLCKERMEAAIPPWVPRRALEGLEPVVSFLESESAKYRELAELRRK